MTMTMTMTMVSPDDLLKDLMKAMYTCMALHGGIDQFDRDSTINDFKSGKINLLVSLLSCLDISGVLECRDDLFGQCEARSATRPTCSPSKIPGVGVHFLGGHPKQSHTPRNRVRVSS